MFPELRIDSVLQGSYAEPPLPPRLRQGQVSPSLPPSSFLLLIFCNLAHNKQTLIGSSTWSPPSFLPVSLSGKVPLGSPKQLGPAGRDKFLQSFL